MKKQKLKTMVILIFSALFLLFTGKAYASEGLVELESQTDEPSRCFAASLRMQSSEYRILFSCRYIIYPVDENIFNYVMWANPVDGGKTIKLGALGLGKGEFKTKTPFDSLFVTTESKKDTKIPTGNVVMSGDVESIEFLGSETTPTPTPDPDAADELTGDEEELEEVQQLTTREKLVLALKRAGIAALFALVALIGIIFVVSRSRG